MSDRTIIALIMIFLSLDIDIILFEIMIRIPLATVAFRIFYLLSRTADVMHGALSIIAVIILISEFKNFSKKKNGQ